MDLADIPLAAGRAGLHLRTAAVHAARAVQPAGPRRAGGPHPLRGVRARPVGTAGLTCSRTTGRPARAGRHVVACDGGRRDRVACVPAGPWSPAPAAGSSSTAHTTAPPSRVGRTPQDSLTPSHQHHRRAGDVQGLGIRGPRATGAGAPYGDAQPRAAPGDRHLDVRPVVGHGVGHQLADDQGRGRRLRAATPVHARPRHQLARLVGGGSVGGHPLADDRGRGAVRERAPHVGRGGGDRQVPAAGRLLERAVAARDRG